MKLKIGILAVILSALAACSSQPPATESDDKSDAQSVVNAQPITVLLNKTWVVDDLNHQGIIDSSRATLTFDDKGRVSGRSFCNRYMGDYEGDNGAIKIEQLAGTMMACPKAIMLAEQAFLKAVVQADSYHINDEGALLLKAGNDVLVKAFVEIDTAAEQSEQE